MRCKWWLNSWIHLSKIATACMSTTLDARLTMKCHNFLKNNAHCFDISFMGISGAEFSDASLTHISSSLIMQQPATASTASSWEMQQSRVLNELQLNNSAWKQSNGIHLFCFSMIDFYIETLYNVLPGEKAYMKLELLNTGNPTVHVWFIFTTTFTNSSLGTSVFIFSWKTRNLDSYWAH